MDVTGVSKQRKVNNIGAGVPDRTAAPGEDRHAGRDEDLAGQRRGTADTGTHRERNKDSYEHNELQISMIIVIAY